MPTSRGSHGGKGEATVTGERSSEDPYAGSPQDAAWAAVRRHFKPDPTPRCLGEYEEFHVAKSLIVDEFDLAIARRGLCYGEAKAAVTFAPPSASDMLLCLSGHGQSIEERLEAVTELFADTFYADVCRREDLFDLQLQRERAARKGSKSKAKGVGGKAKSMGAKGGKACGGPPLRSRNGRT